LEEKRAEKRAEKKRRDQAERLGIECHKQLVPADQAMFAKFSLASRGRKQLASKALVNYCRALFMVL